MIFFFKLQKSSMKISRQLFVDLINVDSLFNQAFLRKQIVKFAVRILRLNDAGLLIEHNTCFEKIIPQKLTNFSFKLKLVKIAKQLILCKKNNFLVIIIDINLTRAFDIKFVNNYILDDRLNKILIIILSSNITTQYEKNLSNNPSTFFAKAGYYQLTTAINCFVLVI